MTTRRSKSKPSRRRRWRFNNPAQFVIVEPWRGKTLARIYRREDGGCHLVGLFAGSAEMCQRVVELAAGQQLFVGVVSYEIDQEFGEKEGLVTEEYARAFDG